MIFDFNTDKNPHIKEIGGKAKALIETFKYNFHVPYGFVLSTSFFLPWILDIKNSAEWKNFLNNPTKDTCDALKHLGTKMTYTKTQKTELDKHLNKFSPSSIFAVRSSSPEEDLDGTSFAGGYETTLGVTLATLENAILSSFVSMFDTRVVEYKKQNNIPINNPRIAIIIQTQIPSEVSGVAFSLNPQNNCYDEAVINSNFGLGESVVSGIVTPDSYILNKVSTEIIEKKISKKSHALYLNPEGGIYNQHLDNTQTESLTESQALQVAELVSRCEKFYNKPIDIEWAFYNDELYLLQARPITTHLPFFKELLTAPGEQKNLYLDMTVLAQGFDEPFSPLGLDIWTLMLSEAKPNFSADKPNSLVVNIHGRQYMHIPNIIRFRGEKAFYKMLELISGSVSETLSTIDIQKEYLPHFKLKNISSPKFKHTFTILSFTSLFIQTYLDHNKTLDKYLEDCNKLPYYCKKELNNNQPFSLLIRNSMKFYKELTRYSKLIILAFFAFSRLTKMFKKDNVDDLLVTLGMDLPGNPTSEMGHLMLKLASYEEIQNTSSEDEFLKKLSTNSYSSEFMQDYNLFIDKFGCRCFKEIDISSPRPYENPEEIFTRLSHINIHDNAMNHVAERRALAYNTLLTLARKKGCEKAFVKYAKMHHDLMGYREHPKYMYVYINDMLRKRALLLGEEFKRKGRLKEATQIFELTLEQLKQAEEDPTLLLLPIIEKNMAPYYEVSHIKEWPLLIDSRGKIFRPVRKGENGDLMGDAIAPGMIRGYAKVLSSPYEKPLNKGEILVTRATEPSWTPIFINAAGVVLEVGGPLQHGGIIAREYGIPCVSGIYDATTIIKDGDLLEVDGSNGIVKVITE